jgi:hypothetical protein
MPSPACVQQSRRRSVLRHAFGALWLSLSLLRLARAFRHHQASAMPEFRSCVDAARVPCSGLVALDGWLRLLSDRQHGSGLGSGQVLIA